MLQPQLYHLEAMAKDFKCEERDILGLRLQFVKILRNIKTPNVNNSVKDTILNLRT